MTRGSIYSSAREDHEGSVFWAASIFLFTLLSVLKGFRWPGSWAATQAQVDYSPGFVKRGLFGATATKVLELNHYLRFAIVSTMLLLGLLILLYNFARSSGLRGRVGSWLPVVTFGASYVVTFLAHMNGYMDIVLAILTTLVLFVREMRLRLFVALAGSILGLLIHELFLLTFLPVLLLSFVLQAWPERDRATHAHAHLGTLALGLVGLGVALRLALRAGLSRPASVAALSRLQTHTDFPLRPDVFIVLNRSGYDNLRLVSPLFTQRGWWLQQLVCVLLFGPVIAFTLYLVLRLIKFSDVPGQSQLFGFCAAVSLCPLLMNLVGLDMGRWYALTGVATFLVFCEVCRFLPGRALHFSSSFQNVGWIVVALGMAAGGMMMDEKTVVTYPFLNTGIGHSLRLPVPAKL